MGFHDDLNRGRVVRVYDQDSSSMGRLVLVPIMSIPKTIFLCWWTLLLGFCSWKLAVGGLLVGYVLVLLSNFPWVLSGLRNIPHSDVSLADYARLMAGEVVDIQPYGRVAIEPRR